MRLSKRESTMVVTCMIFVTGALVFALQPTGGARSGSAALLPVDVAQSRRVTALRTLKQMNEDQSTMEPRIQAASYDLSPEELEPRVVRELQRIAVKSGVHLKEIKPIRAHPLKDAAAIQVATEIRFHAPFQPDVVKFLYMVEDPAGRMTLDRLNVTTADPRSRSVDVTAMISVYTRARAAAGPGEGIDANGNI